MGEHGYTLTISNIQDAAYGMALVTGWFFDHGRVNTTALKSEISFLVSIYEQPKVGEEFEITIKPKEKTA